MAVRALFYLCKKAFFNTRKFDSQEEIGGFEAAVRVNR